MRDEQQTPTLGTLIFALFGAPTQTIDLPLTGSKSYRLTVAEIGTAPAGQTLVIDAQTGRIEGTATTADGAYAGTVRGLSYGPGSVEIGLIFDLVERSSGKDPPGIVLGRAG